MHAAVAFAADEGARKLECTNSAAPVEYALPSANDSIGFTFAGRDGAWIEIEEVGQNVTVATEPPNAMLDIDVPPRYGRKLVAASTPLQMRIARRSNGSASGEIRIEVVCNPDTTFESRLEWFRRAAPLVRQSWSPGDQTTTTALLSAIDQLASSVPDAPSRALAFHLRAQVLLMNGQSRAAGKAFATAAASWDDVDDHARSLAARVGQIEELVRVARYEEVLRLVPPRVESEYRRSYFSVRLQNSRCLSLNYLGRLDDASECYENELARLDDLDERVEFVNVLQNYALLELESGSAEHAERHAKQALQLAEKLDAPMVRGHVRLSLAHIALARGSPAIAISHAEMALADFSAAKSSRWQANSLLLVAEIYSDLGEYTEAYEAIVGAFEHLSGGDAPARVAVALALLANIHRLDNRIDDARQELQTAARMFESLGMPAEREAAELAILRIDLQRGDSQGVGARLDALGGHEPSNAIDRSLLEAELALDSDSLQQGKRVLESTRRMDLGLTQRIRLALVEAEYWRRNHDASHADAALQKMAMNIRELADRSSSRILARLIARQAETLKKAALGGLLDANSEATISTSPDSNEHRAERAWQWLMQTTYDTHVGQYSPAAEDVSRKLDEAVASELLPTKIRSHDLASFRQSAQRALLSVLARTGESPHEDRTENRLPPLSEVQATLDTDTLLIAYLDAGDQAALLVVSRSSVALQLTAAPTDLSSGVTVLRTLLRSPINERARIDAAAARVSTLLWRDAHVIPVPRKLLILAGSQLDAMPWPVIYWPGETVPMADTTTTSIVRIEAARVEPIIPAAVIQLHVVVASKVLADTSILPELDGAGAEPLAIAKSVADRPIVVNDIRDPKRMDVMAALDDKNAWVHIAAHGMAQPSRIGYAGIWLASEPGAVAPGFLSWLDVLEHGVRAALVVLNACQLGNGGDAVSGNLSFASAVSEAGAKQVVASLWPVSDAASAIWVPAFYAALSADPKLDAAAALRVAQLKLRDSRMFRHPFYWAGFQTFTRLDVSALSQSPSSESRSASRKTTPAPKPATAPR